MGITSHLSREMRIGTIVLLMDALCTTILPMLGWYWSGIYWNWLRVSESGMTHSRYWNSLRVSKSGMRHSLYLELISEGKRKKINFQLVFSTYLPMGLFKFRAETLVGCKIWFLIKDHDAKFDSSSRTTHVSSFRWTPTWKMRNTWKHVIAITFFHVFLIFRVEGLIQSMKHGYSLDEGSKSMKHGHGYSLDEESNFPWTSTPAWNLSSLKFE